MQGDCVNLMQGAIVFSLVELEQLHAYRIIAVDILDCSQKTVEAIAVNIKLADVLLDDILDKAFFTVKHTVFQQVN